MGIRKDLEITPLIMTILYIDKTREEREVKKNFKYQKKVKKEGEYNCSFGFGKKEKFRTKTGEGGKILGLRMEWGSLARERRWSKCPRNKENN